MNLLAFAVIGIGAACGAWLRWLLGLALNPLFLALPLGTLAANLIGGYLIGVALGFFHQYADLAPEMKLLVITGFLGGLTTFSTFSAEVVERLLAGQPAWAMTLAGIHLFGSLSMTWLGLYSIGANRLWS
ncbi:fluoride efflux transporter CrcB [Rhodocyclus tenuis]|uniref:Fluoride-specific ion channel FluC n=1 Tax=Rhodocyclus tenuis TaxID=1066 RepID=A0A840FXT9_RHOTE|nr:fluoride efflux transporter CrcB [Rhodocyclus tenuis]MBB4246937.1 CrcB protein [Rhodocyclus tenuis]